MDVEVLHACSQTYLQHSRACADQLHHVWQDLELAQEDQRRELGDITNHAQQAWSEAVQFAEDKRASLQQRVNDYLNEIDRIKEQLGEDDGVELTSEMSESSFSAPLMRRYQAVHSRLDSWKARKTERQGEYEAIQSEILGLKSRFGHSIVPAKRAGAKANDMSHAGLQILTLELENLHAERAQRERKLDMLLGRLRKACIELDEDDNAAAAAAHPSLQNHRDHLPGHSYTYKSPAKREAAAAAVDLSNTTFLALEDQIEGLDEIREYREQRAGELMGVLCSLWEALEVEQEDVDRGIFTRLMSGPARLHGKSIQKCMAEVGRLESCKTEVMRRLITEKWSDVQAVCTASHLDPPALPLLYHDALSGNSSPNSGQVSEVLAKVVRQQADVAALAEKRAEVLSCVEEFEAVRAECRWLSEYENDEMRYKGRDANRRLQRSIKAGKQRERLPSLVEQLRQVLTQWQMQHRIPFTYGSQDYKDVLDEVAAEIEHEEQLRTQHANQKKQAAAMSGSKGKPPNSASKLRPSLLGMGSRDKGAEKTPSRGPLLRLPWGARTPKRTSDFSSDQFGVERSSQSMAVHSSGHSIAVQSSGPSMALMHGGQGAGLVGPLQDKLNRLLLSSNSPSRPSTSGGLIPAGRYDNVSSSLSSAMKGRVPSTPYNTPTLQGKSSTAHSPLRMTSDENYAVEQRPLGSWLKQDTQMASPASSSKSVMSPSSGASYAGSNYSQTNRMESNRYHVTPLAANANSNNLGEYTPVMQEASHYSTSSHAHQTPPLRDDPLRQSF